jgi:hypothetical protein
MAILGWEAPPQNAVEAGQKHTKWAAVADLLRTRPGEWAKVSVKTSRQQAVTLTNGIALGRREEFAPAGTFAAKYAEGAEKERTVLTKDGEQKTVQPVAVYAMFVGSGSNGSSLENGGGELPGADANAEEDPSAWDDDED